MFKYHTKGGFTLVEILVVIAVLGILMGIGVPRLTGVVDQAREAEYKALGDTIRSGLEMVRIEEDGYPGEVTIQMNSGPAYSTADTWNTLRDILLTQDVDIGEEPDDLADYTYDDSDLYELRLEFDGIGEELVITPQRVEYE